ncbi:MAE_28990/MAE_18760 family HEPN-like nuclease [Shewanella indica]|uniref:MAE_28990/MAE_18760 family HEPN-like nuclease n=1 Tax=Shewanella indica TaxID=768528 RepID=UPI003999C443
MFDSTTDFTNNISSLIDHLNYEKSRGDFLKNIVRKYNCKSAIKDEIEEYLNDVEKASLINAKKFTYTNSIISLYGYLENFIENIAVEFIQKLNQIDIPFTSLPKEIRRFHLESSIDLLKKVQRTKGNNRDQKNNRIKKILLNMHTCAEEFENYQLNEEAFSLHTANFRYDSIHNLFCKIGIHGVPRISLSDKELRSTLANKHTIDEDIERKIFVSLLASELDDLAQRRNEIAHGSFDGELESIDLVIERALCLMKFGASVSKILNDYFYQFVFESSSKVSLGLPTEAYNGSCIFGFLANPNHNIGKISSINTGDVIFAHNESSTEKLKYGKIVSIVKNREDTECLEIPSDTDFAIKVDFEFSSHMKTREVYILKQA